MSEESRSPQGDEPVQLAKSSSGYQPNYHKPSYEISARPVSDPGSPTPAPEAGDPVAFGPPTTAPSEPEPTAAAFGPVYPAGGFPPGGPIRPGFGPGPIPAAPPPPPPPRAGGPPPRRVEPVPGTAFGVVYLDVSPVTSGLAVSALISGVLSILVSLLVGCFGLAGASGGWGAWAAGAFALFAALLGAAGIILGLLGRRQINRVGPSSTLRFSGRGLAIAGLSCGATGLGLTLFAFALALLLQVA